MNLIIKILQKIYTADELFIQAHQNPVKVTRKMRRIAIRRDRICSILWGKVEMW